MATSPRSGDDEGTSAATPLWASLMAQVDTIFADQGLPHLGFANDLLYIAGAIAPGSFNDITFGNNVTSYIDGAFPGGATVIDADGNPITLTGYGYFAGPGYDLTTGLGSPNGVLLARAMTVIAHSQMSYSSSPDMLDAAGAGWASGADQSLMFQTMSASAATVGVDIGTAASSASRAWRPVPTPGPAGWRSRCCSPTSILNLVRLFDKQAQGWVGQSVVEAGEQLSVSINAQSTVALQASMTSPFDFADFTSASGAVRVARAGGRRRDGRRGRRHGRDRARAPERRGQPVAHLLSRRRSCRHDRRPARRPRRAMPRRSQARAYQLTSGGTALGGPGYGNFGQSGLTTSMPAISSP